MWKLSSGSQCNLALLTPRHDRICALNRVFMLTILHSAYDPSAMNIAEVLRTIDQVIPAEIRSVSVQVECVDAVRRVAY